ncbi:MAG TPA: response regulator [Caulobacteraceae bacterium]|nr:response regulator [Caulobacteraceae bacterium]
MSAGTWREDARRRDWSEAARAQPRAPQSRSHVLILDDHAPSRDICAGYCDLFDHTSESVGAAGEAVAALRRSDFGVVVLNVHADAWNALEVIPAIRALPGAAGLTPIIGLTGVGRAHEAQRWLAAGLAAVLPKPVTAARLFAALGAALDDGEAEPRSWAPAG